MNLAGKRFDPYLFAFTLIVSIIGLFAILDAGYVRTVSTGSGLVPKEFMMQGLYLGCAIVGSGLMAWLHPEHLKRWSPVIWLASLLLLVVVSRFGHDQDGGQRWLKIGEIRVQPAEIVKLSTILFLAALFGDRKKWPSTIPPRKSFVHWMDTIAVPKITRALPAIGVAVAVYLIERENDLGTAAIVAAISFGLFFIGGVSWKSLLTMVVVTGVFGYHMATSVSYRLERIEHHAHRWEAEYIDEQGYQTVQSELAMAWGHWGGVGMGMGRAKRVLPAKTTTTDFIMTTVSEEFGLIGSLLVVGLIALIVVRLFTLAGTATTRFGALTCYGVGIWISLQACINVMMANGTLCAIGIPFPFISYGGSSLCALWLAIGACQASQAPALVREETNATGRNRRRNRRARLSGARSRV